jgi:hypothetical protein
MIPTPRQAPYSQRGEFEIPISLQFLPDFNDSDRTMTLPAPPARAASPVLSPALLPVYGAAIFLSAALLFAVQPMFTKMVLPRLGGSPSVWSVAMVFFQAMLLGGYAYAHLLTRFLPVRTAIVVQVVLLTGAALALPLAIRSGWGRPPEQGEALWLIGLFTASIGLPFFALSANGPLLQAWFSRTGHPAAGNPYFLYAASNIGSFLALISYPIVVEPLVRLGDQTRAWSAGFVVLIVLIAASGALLWRGGPERADDTAGDTEAPAPSLRDALTWMALAAVPSGLLVAVTAHISTDVAAVPLLWVVPLALYLLTFVIVFSTRPIIPHRLALALQPFLVAALVAVLVFDVTDSIILQIALHLLTFFVSALVCHGELARRRPAPRHLTAFYMWMSAGGMIGGLGAGLIAPHVFAWVAEYPILIALALLCRPGTALPQGRERIVWIAALVLGAFALLASSDLGNYTSDTVQKIIAGVLLVAALTQWRRPLILAAVVAFIFGADRIYNQDSDTETMRSFFGVLTVRQDDDNQFRTLLHGTTIHGAERIRDPDEDEGDDLPEPLTYYHDGSNLVATINAARARAGRPIKFAVIGLGAGSLACRAQDGNAVTFYEIDPLVVRIAQDSDRFTFLSKCAPDAPIVIGDARLTLADAPDGAYDLIIVDAFSSDSIPMHLMTREAMALYVRKLAPAGMVVMHLSNRHLELASVAAGIAQANGLTTRVKDDGDEGADDEENKYTSTVAAAARSEADFGPLATSAGWAVTQPDPTQWVWTDDYSNIVGAMLRNLKKK